ncbi:MAG: hypothetical protein EDR02_02470 [Actinobacteria bacterium]|nr:MAG: hypothetical protein EDR02_02470 [Actinomycetota bacterium]RIK07571.1 MAG: hypothetical protein DCC48_03480 [Acidobacteriota bacterium]
MQQVLHVALKTPPSERTITTRQPVAVGAVVAHFASLVVGFAALVYLGRHQWFFADEWAALLKRGLGLSGEDGLLQPHNEHWIAGPILIYRMIYNLIGVKSYIPYLACDLALHVALAHVLWQIMRKLRVDAWVSTALSTMFVFLGAGAENILWAFQVGFIGSFLLGFIALYLVMDGTVAESGDRGFGSGTERAQQTEVVSPPKRAASSLSVARIAWASGLCVASLAFSSNVIPVIVVVAAVAWYRQDLRAAGGVALAPAAVFAGWMLLYGRGGLGAHEITAGSLVALPAFVALGLARSLQAIIRIPGLVVSLAALAGIWLWWRERTTQIALIIAGGAVLFFALTGIGRVAEFGVGFAKSERYVYLGVALLLPLAGVLLTMLIRDSFRRQALVLVLLAYALVSNALLLRARAGEELVRETQIREEVLAAAQLQASGEVLLADSPDILESPDVSWSGVAALRADGALPDDQPRAKALDRARLRYQAVFGATAGFESGLEGCLVSDAGAPLRVTGPASYTLDAPPDVTIEAALDPSGPWVALDRNNARPVLDVAIEEPDVLLDSEDGSPFEVCGAG